MKVEFNGITIGTHARKVISNYKESPKDISNDNLLKSNFQIKKSDITKPLWIINLNIKNDIQINNVKKLLKRKYFRKIY